MKTITESDWLAAWDQERQAAAKPPPSGFYTLNQIASRLGMPLATARQRVQSSIRSGLMEVGLYLVENTAGRSVMTKHYRVIAAPAATTKKPGKKGQ